MKESSVFMQKLSKEADSLCRHSSQLILEYKSLCDNNKADIYILEKIVQDNISTLYCSNADPGVIDKFSTIRNYIKSAKEKKEILEEQAKQALQKKQNSEKAKQKKQIIANCIAAGIAIAAIYGTIWGIGKSAKYLKKTSNEQYAKKFSAVQKLVEQNQYFKADKQSDSIISWMKLDVFAGKELLKSIQEYDKSTITPAVNQQKRIIQYTKSLDNAKSLLAQKDYYSAGSACKNLETCLQNEEPKAVAPIKASLNAFMQSSLLPAIKSYEDSINTKNHEFETQLSEIMQITAAKEFHKAGSLCSKLIHEMKSYSNTKSDILAKATDYNTKVISAEIQKAEKLNRQITELEACFEQAKTLANEEKYTKARDICNYITDKLSKEDFKEATSLKAKVESYYTKNILKKSQEYELKQARHQYYSDKFAIAHTEACKNEFIKSAKLLDALISEMQKDKYADQNTLHAIIEFNKNAIRPEYARALARQKQKQAYQTQPHKSKQHKNTTGKAQSKQQKQQYKTCNNSKTAYRPNTQNAKISNANILDIKISKALGYTANQLKSLYQQIENFSYRLMNN